MIEELHWNYKNALASLSKRALKMAFNPNLRNGGKRLRSRPWSILNCSKKESVMKPPILGSKRSHRFR